MSDKDSIITWEDGDSSSKSRAMERFSDSIDAYDGISKANHRTFLDIEPNIKPVFAGGAYYDYAYHAKDPQGIVKKIFELFIKKGGKFVQENVELVKQTNPNETIA